MPKPPTRRPPDPKVCAVARAVGEVVHPDRVILFGSRARGDFTPDSKTQKRGARNDPKPSRRTPSTRRRYCAALQFAQADRPARGAQGHEGTAAVDRGLEAVFIQRALRYYRKVGGDAPTRGAGVHL